MPSDIGDDDPTPPRGRARSHWSDEERVNVGREHRNAERNGAPDRAWHEEDTAAHTDVQVFRALKGLRADLETSKVEAARAHGALKAEVVELRGTLTKQGEKLDDVTTTAARMEGKLDVILADRRPASTSAQSRVVETLLADRANENQHRRERWTIGLRGLVSIATAAPVVTLIIAWLAGGHC